MAGRYLVVAPAVVRTEATADSALATPPRLEVGEEIEVTATETVRTGKRGTVLRLQFEGGWVSQRAQSGKLLVERLSAESGEPAPDGAGEASEPQAEPEAEPADESAAVICVMKAVQKLEVQDGISASSRTIGELHVGDAVGVLEEKAHKGHERVRIMTQHAEEAWCTRHTKGSGDSPGIVQLEVDESITEAEPWVPTHETTVFDELIQFKVLEKCTVRMGPEKDDIEVGKYNKGTVLDVVQEVINFKGLTTYQSITPVKGKQTGGWVKLETSKGKTLLERVEPDPTHAKCEAELLDFLTSRGHSAIVSRVCKALDSVADDPTQWIKELEQMETDGDLGAFLQSCHDTMDDDPNETDTVEATDHNADEQPTHLITLERPPSPGSGGRGFGMNLAPDCVVTSFSHEESCAKVAGVQIGNHILEINGNPVSTKEDAVSRLAETQPGSTVSFLLAGTAGRRWDPTAGKWIGDAEDDGSEEPNADEGDQSQGEDGDGHTSEEEPLDFTSGPVKFAVLAACTVREGPDSSSVKVGEHKQGDTIDVVQEATNSDGLKVYQTITAPKGANRGGWVKLKTSKGKELVSRCVNFSSTVEDEEQAPDPKDPPHDLVPLEKFLGKIGKVKVKITVDGAGIFVVEDTQEAKKVLSYSTRRIVRCQAKKKSLLLVTNDVNATTTETTFLLNNPEALEAALMTAEMAACTWKVDAEAWQDDALTEEEKKEKEAAVAKIQKRDADITAADLRQEIGNLRLKELRKKARDVGVSEDTLSIASDAEKPKAAVIEVIIAHVINSRADPKPVAEPTAPGLVPEGDPPERSGQGYNIDPVNHAETIARQKAEEEKEAAQTEALLQEAARLIDWQPGMVIDVDTEDGLEKGATIVGPSSDGNPKQMQIRFADGTVDDWDKEDFVSRGGDEEEDPAAGTPRGNAAAIALQQEVIKHGTGDVAKISKLRRASLEPADAHTAMTAAAAAAADDDEKVASLERDMKQLSDLLAKERQAHASTQQELQQLREKLDATDAQLQALQVERDRSRTLLEEELAAHDATKVESKEKGAALDKLSGQLTTLETVHAETSAQSAAAVEAALDAADAARAEANAASEALVQHKSLEQRQQGTMSATDEDVAAKDREILKLREKISSLEEMMQDRSSDTLTWNLMDDMLTSDALLRTDDERWT